MVDQSAVRGGDKGPFECGNFSRAMRSALHSDVRAGGANRSLSLKKARSTATNETVAHGVPAERAL